MKDTIKTNTNIANFKAFCINRKLNAQDVGDILGVSKIAVYAYWQGQRIPTPLIMDAMVKKLGLSPDNLYEFFIRGE